MSHILIRKLTGLPHSFADKEWWYAFGAEMKALDIGRIKRFINRKQAKCKELTAIWDDELNTEWTCRVFFAAKMVLTASLMLESLNYAREKNLRVCIPYLQYYSLLYSLKALVVVLPEQIWNNANLIEQTHAKTIEIACDEISKINPEWKRSQGNSRSVKEQILKLKAFREFISYRAPSSGGNLNEYDIDVLPLCKVSVELAQMISEIFEKSMLKNMHSGYEPKLLRENIKGVYLTSIGSFEFIDKEDHYRIDYLLRKYPVPTNIQQIMTEGHVEDFFGSWCDADEREDVFDPYENGGILFDLP